MLDRGLRIMLDAYFREFRKAEVRRIPKFSGSSPVASRNRLLRFLAPFVATWSGYRGRSGSCTQKGDSFEGGEPEIATANFREFLFPRTRVNSAREKGRGS